MKGLYSFEVCSNENCVLFRFRSSMNNYIMCFCNVVVVIREWEVIALGRILVRGI